MAQEMFNAHRQHTGFGIMYFFVYSCSPDMQKCCFEPAYENPRWRIRPDIVIYSVRDKIFVKFQRLYSQSNGGGVSE